MIFEDRSSYDEEKDPVARIALDVECAPGQVDAISDFLKQVAAQAGVYSVEISCDVHIPSVKVEVPQPVEAPPSEAAPEPAPVIEDTKEPHAEPQLQQASEQPEAVPEVGSEASGDGKPGPVDAGEDSQLAVAAGEGGAGP